jgi:hypothetical protein
MYQEPGHPLPHLHVDYGPDRHAASYALDGSGRLVGALDAKYDKVLVPWIAAHRESLLAWWHTLQLGADPRVTIGEIKGDA